MNCASLSAQHAKVSAFKLFHAKSCRNHAAANLLLDHSSSGIVASVRQPLVTVMTRSFTLAKRVFPQDVKNCGAYQTTVQVLVGLQTFPDHKGTAL